jgi:hypothetical protein
MTNAGEVPTAAEYVGLFLALSLLAFLLPAATAPPELAVRISGGLFQLAGILTVAAGIARMRRRFSDRPGIVGIVARLLSRVWRRIHRLLPWRKGKSVIIQVAGATTGTSIMKATVRTGLNKTGTLEDQVRQLQQFAEQLQIQMDAVGTEVSEEQRERRESDEEERKAREEADAKLRQDLTELAVGGLHLETAGITWLVLGTVLLTWPELAIPLAGLLHP